MGSIPIGRPIANTEVYLLDSQLSPVPIGVSGELYIGGDGLARGYLNRPELTAEKFIAHPFTKERGARLYKTGDVARYLPDGNIEFLGRMDHQVKVRGYRIEVGEIESALGQHPAVRDAVVLAREDTLGDPSASLMTGKRLVAYVVPRREPAPIVSGLNSFLKEKLPQYMIPSAFVFVDIMPLTPNGKIDRKALPAPDQSRPEMGELYVAPRTPVEEMIAEIWAQVLKLDTIGVHDNFFELGGHSLLAAQVVSRIREALQADLPLRVLFEKPTVASLSDYVEAVRWVEKDRSQTHGSKLGETEDILL
jgi:acyl carrier protein